MDAPKDSLHSASDGSMTAVVRTIVDLLVRGDYVEVERLTEGVRLTADELRFAVDRYGRRLVDPPDSAWSKLDAVLVTDAEPPRHHVTFDLWAEDEGQSDLTLEMWLSEAPDGGFRAQILNLHTL
jgi:hypothetical protein